MSMYKYVHMYVYVYMRLYVNMCMYMLMHMCVYMYKYLSDVHVCVRSYVYGDIYLIRT